MHRCPERDKSVPRTPDPAMAFPQLMRARSGQRKPAPFCKVRQGSSGLVGASADISLTTVTPLQQTENLRSGQRLPYARGAHHQSSPGPTPVTYGRRGAQGARRNRAHGGFSRRAQGCARRVGTVFRIVGAPAASAAKRCGDARAQSSSDEGSRQSASIRCAPHFMNTIFSSSL